MILTDKEAELFYELWIPLLDFVNQKHHIKKELYGMTSPKGLPLESIAMISGKLWNDVSVIDEYIVSVERKLLPEHISMVREWKKAVRGEFIVDRHLRNGSVLVSCADDKVYVVCGIYSSWRELLTNFPMPQIVKTTIIPFQDKIIHDGIVQPYGICLGKNLSDASKQLYKEAKAEGKLITIL